MFYDPTSCVLSSISDTCRDLHGSLLVNALVEIDALLLDLLKSREIDLELVQPDQLLLLLIDSKQLQAECRLLGRSAVGLTDRYNELLISELRNFGFCINPFSFLSFIFLLVIGTGQDEIDAGWDLNLYLVDSYAEVKLLGCSPNALRLDTFTSSCIGSSSGMDTLMTISSSFPELTVSWMIRGVPSYHHQISLTTLPMRLKTRRMHH